MIIRELSAVSELLPIHARSPQRYPYLLESVAGEPGQEGFDILFAVRGAAQTFAADTLQNIDAAWEKERVSSVDIPFPFHGGWFVYLGYELAAEIEPTLSLPEFQALPTAVLHRAPGAFVRDRTTGTISAIVEENSEPLLAQMMTDSHELAPLEFPSGQMIVSPITEQNADDFIRAVQRAREHIAAGDIFQANLSRRWNAELAADVTPARLYAKLRATNPAPFAALAHFGEQTIVSSSPERLLEVRNGTATTRPIAGTRPRGHTESDDSVLSSELFASDKERAEHVMLIDLERNDLGRICVPGSVHVDEFMVLESYSHVHHIVSNVVGRLLEDVTPGDAIRAVFPGGTITGCPKVRCMEIIAELEAEARGPYTGSLGYINRDGSLDLNILIRTLFVDATHVSLRAGGGIVADSEPHLELAETRAKARGLLLALDS